MDRCRDGKSFGSGEDGEVISTDCAVRHGEIRSCFSGQSSAVLYCAVRHGELLSDFSRPDRFLRDG